MRVLSATAPVLAMIVDQEQLQQAEPSKKQLQVLASKILPIVIDKQ
jgi:hypothetical protein